MVLQVARHGRKWTSRVWALADDCWVISPEIIHLKDGLITNTEERDVQMNENTYNEQKTIIELAKVAKEVMPKTVSEADGALSTLVGLF